MRHRFRPPQFWMQEDLEGFATALVTLLKSRGKIFECSGMRERGWGISWLDREGVCLVVVTPWVYPALWRIYVNMPPVGFSQLTYNLFKREGLWLTATPQPPRPAELTATGGELASLAGAALLLGQGEEPGSVALLGGTVPGCWWTPDAEATWGNDDWMHRRGHWVKRKVYSGVGKVSKVVG